MCDYSLQQVASRPASVGDKLVTSRFTGAFSQGFASASETKDEVGNCTTAICVVPGTEIGFDDDITTRAMYGMEEKSWPYTVGIFRQINAHNPYMHHDALELPNGEHVLVNELKLGLGATVLQLPAAPKNETEAKAQERLEVVG